MEVIVKKFLATMMFALSANLFGMQSSIDSQLEQVAQEFHACYAKVRIVIEKITADQVVEPAELTTCEKDLVYSKNCLKIAKDFLRKRGAEMSDELCYRCAQLLGVPALQPFDVFPQEARLLMLQDYIAAQIISLDSDIEVRCPLIIRGCKAALELRKGHSENMKACASNFPHLADVVEAPLFPAKSHDTRNLLIAATSAIAGVGLTGWVMLHGAKNGTTLKQVVVDLPKVLVTVTPVSRRIYGHFLSLALSMIGSGLWAASRSTAEIARNTFNIAEPLSWFQLFSGM